MESKKGHIASDQKPKKRKSPAGDAYPPQKCDELMPSEVRALQEYAAGWIEEAVPHREKLYRSLAYAYVAIILNTGLRPREAQAVRWSGLVFKERGPHKYVFLTVGKGPQIRNVVGGNYTVAAFEKIKAICPPTSVDDLVFRTIEGVPAADLYFLKLRSLLMGAGVNYSQTGWERLPECFRHTNAILRMLEDPLSLYAQFGSPMRMIRRRYGYILKQNKRQLAALKKEVANLTGLDSAKSLGHTYVLWANELRPKARKKRPRLRRKKVRGRKSGRKGSQ